MMQRIINNPQQRRINWREISSLVIKGVYEKHAEKREKRIGKTKIKKERKLKILQFKIVSSFKLFPN